jgi:hypothetical protein
VSASRERRWAWLVPIGVVGLTAAGAFAVHVRHDPEPKRLASQPTAAKLVAAIKGSTTVGFSGTVVSTTSITLPDMTDYAAMSAFAAVGLLAGSHTARVWYDGAKRQRVALVGSNGEVDYFHSGADYWRWDPMARTAVGMAIPQAGSQVGWSPIPRVLPGQLAWWAVNCIDGHTHVALDRSGRVAGRAVYRLRVEPNQTDSLISAIQISADARTYLPLGVRVYAKGQSAPAMTTAFTHVSYGRPDSANFAFSPPPDAIVWPSARTGPQSTVSGAPGGQNTDNQPAVQVKWHSKGWRRVAELQVGGAEGYEFSQPDPGVSGTRAVWGRWGYGVLYTSRLVSVLVTKTGRILVGDVRPKFLLQCA